jgi:hypothetical protein
MANVPPIKSFAIRLMLGMIGRVPQIAAIAPAALVESAAIVVESQG